MISMHSIHSGWPLERQDFSTDVISITFPADEIGSATNFIDVTVSIIDDEIDEAEEFFIVVLRLNAENATVPNKIGLSRKLSVGRIIDNDGWSTNTTTIY